MFARVITLHCNAVLGGFDDTSLREFLKGKAVLSIRDHFFIRNDVPCLAMIVPYTLPYMVSPAAPVGPVYRPCQQAMAMSRSSSCTNVYQTNGLIPWRLVGSCESKTIAGHHVCSKHAHLYLLRSRRGQGSQDLGEHFGYHCRGQETNNLLDIADRDFRQPRSNRRTLPPQARTRFPLSVPRQ